MPPVGDEEPDGAVEWAERWIRAEQHLAATRGTGQVSMRQLARAAVEAVRVYDELVGYRERRDDGG